MAQLSIRRKEAQSSFPQHSGNLLVECIPADFLIPFFHGHISNFPGARPQRRACPNCGGRGGLGLQAILFVCVHFMHSGRLAQAAYQGLHAALPQRPSLQDISPLQRDGGELTTWKLAWPWPWSPPPCLPLLQSDGPLQVNVLSSSQHVLHPSYCCMMLLISIEWLSLLSTASIAGSPIRRSLISIL